MRKLIAILSILFTLLALSAQTAGIEWIAITTDRDVYVAGDRLYFSLKLTNSSERNDSYAYISLNSDNGNAIFTGCIAVTAGNSFGSIALSDTIESGLYQLVVFTSCIRNYGSENFTRKTILIINRFDSDYRFMNYFAEEPVQRLINLDSAKQAYAGALQIITDKVQYHLREKVKVQVRFHNSLPDNPVSVAIRQVAPVEFITADNSQQQTAATKSCHYIPEKSGLILQGTLQDTGNKAVANAPVYLSCEDSTANLQYAFTNSDGTFRFFLNPWYFDKTLRIKPENDFHGSIEMDDKFASAKGFRTPVVSITGDLTQFAAISQQFLTIRKSYFGNDSSNSTNAAQPAGFRPVVYSNATRIIKPSDFTYLPDFMEISREILPFIKTRLSGGEYKASVFDPQTQVYNDLLVFIDGYLAENIGQAIYLDSKKIRKIEIVTSPRIIGELLIPGVISITTNNHEIENLAWNHLVRTIEPENILKQELPYPFDTGSLQRNIPDFRQLLYWNPSPPTDNKMLLTFETTTSDCTGKFEIVVSCIGDRGELKEFKNTFEVIH
jgi:hypothetical protein